MLCLITFIVLLLRSKCICIFLYFLFDELYCIVVSSYCSLFLYCIFLCFLHMWRINVFIIRICNNVFEQCVICRFNKVVYVCSVSKTNLNTAVQKQPHRQKLTQTAKCSLLSVTVGYLLCSSGVSGSKRCCKC